MIDLRSARKLKDIVTGGHLAHPEAIVAPSGNRAYIAVTDRDQVAVIDTRGLRVERYLNVGNAAGIGTSPDALAVTSNGGQLLVAEAGTDRISVFGLPQGRSGGFPLQGRIPVARYPTDVQVTGGRRPLLLWTAAKGLGTGPNPKGPNPFGSATLGQSSGPSQFLPYILGDDPRGDGDPKLTLFGARDRGRRPVPTRPASGATSGRSAYHFWLDLS